MKNFAGKPANIVKHVVLITGALIMVLPFVWMLSTSLKPPHEVLSWPPQLIPQTFTMENYVKVFETAPFARFFMNSILMASLSTVSILVTSSIAGYVFAKFKFPFKNFLFILTLSTAMVPLEVYMIPLYLSMVEMGWVNKFAGLVAPYLIMSYGIFFMRQNIMASIPDELLDAARIDGASEWKIFFMVVFPMLSGPIGAISIFAFQQTWAAFIWPLIITSSRELWTMELGLGMFQYRFTVDLGPINAGSMLSIIPVLIMFLLMRKKIIQGITLTGMKG